MENKKILLDKLKGSPKNLILFVITIIGLIIFILINQLIFVPLATSVPVYGILNFEFAWTPEQVKAIFTTWGAEGMVLQALGVYWDFLYIIGYSLFIFGCILLISRRLKGKFQIVGLYASLTPIIAGIFDVLENLNLLIMLENPASFPSFIPLIASMCATIKFSFLIIAIIYFVFALIVLIINIIKEKTK